MNPFLIELQQDLKRMGVGTESAINGSDAVDYLNTLAERVEREMADDAAVPAKPHWPLFNFQVPDHAWEQTGCGDDLETRLLATISINGTHMHLEAIQVKKVTTTRGNHDYTMQVAVDEQLEDDVEGYQRIQGTEFSTTTINGREYIFVATPFGD